MEDIPPQIDTDPSNDLTRRVILAGMAVGAGGVALALSGCSSHHNGGPRVPAETGPALPEFDPNTKLNLLEAEWKYTDGLAIQDRGMHVTPVPTMVVKLQHPSQAEQNLGPTSYISEPNINLYGTHLELGEGEQGDSDFGIVAEISALEGAGTLHILASPPWELDERQVLRPGLSITVTRKGVTLQGWDSDRWQGQAADESQGGTQEDNDEPDFTKKIPYVMQNGAGAQLRLKVVRQGSELFVSFGGQVHKVPTGAGFSKSGQVWLGMDATSERGWQLSTLEAYAVKGGSIEGVDTTTMELPELIPSGLQLRANRKRAELGLPPVDIMTAVDLAPLVSVPSFRKLIGEQFGGVTTEVSAKWNRFEAQRGQLTPGATDAIVDIAHRKDRSVHLHAGAFEEALPPDVRRLFLDPEIPKHQKQAAFDWHMDKFLGRYTKEGEHGFAKSIDVVNEILDDDNEFRHGPLFAAFGQDYVAHAFRQARKLNKDATLVLNEYGLESGDPDRWGKFIGLLEGWLKDGVPIDCVGFQSHVYEAGDAINGEVLASRFKQLKELGERYGVKGGLRVRVSEASVESDSDGGGRAFQERQYAVSAKALMEAENGIAYCVWGPATAPWYMTAGPEDNGNDAPWHYVDGAPHTQGGSMKAGAGAKGIQRGIARAA